MLPDSNKKGILAAEVLVPGLLLITIAVIIVAGTVYCMNRRKRVRSSESLSVVCMCVLEYSYSPFPRHWWW